MNIALEEYAYYIRPGYTDMRKQGSSLAQMVQEAMKLDPFSKSVFIFCGRTRKKLKALVWDKNGWIEISKKLECKGRFHWPINEEEAQQVSLERIKGLLSGYDVWQALPEIKAEVVM